MAKSSEHPSAATFLLVTRADESLVALDVILEPLGHHGIRVRSTEAALAAVRSTDFAVLLVEADAGDDVDFTAGARIREAARSPRTPLIFLTANRTQTEGYEHGAVDVLALPVDPAVLRAKVAVFADLFRQREEDGHRAVERVLHEQRAAGLVERTELLALDAEVGLALGTRENAASALAAVAEAIVRHLDAAFARIWISSDDGTMLELRASAGMYTHLDGPHGRVAMGALKIGSIAAERKPHLTNQVIGDPRVGDQEWAKKNGLVAFAGYPIILGDRLIGVIALFARHALSEAALVALQSIAAGVGQGLERARNEERIRASESWLSTTLTSIGDGVIATDAQGVVSYLNPVAADLTGWTTGEAKGRHLDEVLVLVNETTRAPVESPVAKVVREGVVVGMANHTLLLRRDGTAVAIEDSAAPIRAGSEELTGVVLVFRDASEQRRIETERALLVEEARSAHSDAVNARDHLQSLFMQAPAPIAIIRGREHVFELTNPGYRRLVGERDLIGLPVRKALPEMEGQGFFELLDSVYSTGERFVGKELSIRFASEADGSLQESILNFVYEPFREIDGSVGGILVLVNDVTDVVRARRTAEQSQAATERLNAELAEAESVLRSLVDNLPELAWSAQADGSIDFYNQRWFDYTGTTADEVAGWGWSSVHHPEILPKVVETWKASIETGKDFEMEFPLRGADGVFRWFLTRARPLRTSTGKILRWFGINSNVNAQREAARQAEEANLAKDEFLATASHELRTPLNAILGWAQMMRSGKLDPSAYMRGAEAIERNAKAQVQLIEDILDGSRIITGQLRLEIRPLDMSALVRAALDAVRPAAAAKGIALNTELDPAAARIDGDPDRLQQVVWNLANNAVKFTPKGGTIDVRLTRSGTSVELAIADSGQGIAPEFLPHVFERFRQQEGSTTRRHGGLGLGLALVRHLVEAHGGTVQAESEGPGRGSRFVVLLPVQAIVKEAPASEDQPLLTRDRAEMVVPYRLSGVRVLVVDDEADARDLVATVLRANGAEVATAGSAAEALERIAERAPSILISDIGMAEVDGYALIKRLRERKTLPGADVPAIALTAYSREQDRRRALEAGFQTHVAKPVEPAELVRVVLGLSQFVDR